METDKWDLKRAGVQWTEDRTKTEGNQSIFADFPRWFFPWTSRLTAAQERTIIEIWRNCPQ